MRVVSSDFFFFEPPLENSELALKIEVSEIEFRLLVPSRQPPTMRRQVGGEERREEGWGQRGAKKTAAGIPCVPVSRCTETHHFLGTKRWVSPGSAQVSRSG